MVKADAEKSGPEKVLRQRKREIDVRVAELKGERKTTKDEIDTITKKLRAGDEAADRKQLSVQKERMRTRSKEISSELSTLTAEKKTIIEKLGTAASG